MRRIKSKGMRPEVVVRSAVHRLGFRFRLHARDLPGKPDLVFRKRKKIIDVRGCFWHQHTRCAEAHIPKTRPEYWIPKLARNRKRDASNCRRLRALGWQVLVVWECETSDLTALSGKLFRFLSR